ncbi:MAG: hypothetical protein R3E32_07570 [Chitinophagales bacterium]
MNIQIIKDPTGTPQSVVIPYQEWKKYELQNLKIKNKLEVLKGLQQAVEEVKEIKKGKRKGKTLKQFLNECRDNNNTEL